MLADGKYIMFCERGFRTTAERRHDVRPCGAHDVYFAHEFAKYIKKSDKSDFFGDPYGIRTHVTAVKGRCLNRLTKGPYCGSGGQIRTNDLPGMNRPL